MKIGQIEYFSVLPFSCISAISCSFIIFICVSSEYIRRNNQYKLLFILSVIELIYFLNQIFPAIALGSEYLCIIQGLINQSTSLSKIIWISYISFEMFSVVIKENSSLKYGLYKPLFFVCFLSSALSFIPFGLGLYGESGAWCWIKSDNSNKYVNLAMNLGLFYGLAWSSIIFNTIISVIVSRKLKILCCGNQVQIVRKIKNYPIMLFIVYLPISISRLLQFFNKSNPIFDILTYIFKTLEGFGNFMIFVNQSDVKSFLREKFKKKKGKVLISDLD